MIYQHISLILKEKRPQTGHRTSSRNSFDGLRTSSPWQARKCPDEGCLQGELLWGVLRSKKEREFLDVFGIWFRIGCGFGGVGGLICCLVKLVWFPVALLGLPGSSEPELCD